MTVISFACPCGAQDEVREPCPARIDCWRCARADGMARWSPFKPPPVSAGREWKDVAEDRQHVSEALAA